ncbi:hypothetical protein DSO57_1018555 [Entomophthora muscae]|uniref:Uncharacterized protein n=1 Tax=Entomophthora muscae TaxID=34485 RepID=A0ACC2TFC5_9FUNG|nr:hypothetical protein DSO57_1018555 [Entomophthora muscae]
MKYIVSFFFAALVSGQWSKLDARSAKDVCSHNATVFTVNPLTVLKNTAEPLLRKESEVAECKNMSGAKVFVIVSPGFDAHVSTDYRLRKLRPLFNEIDLLYTHPSYKFYDSLAFRISGLNETSVDLLLKERQHDKVFSLLLSVNKWSEVQKAISKYAGKIHHLEVSVEENRESLETLKGLLERYPRIKVSVTFRNDKKHTKILSEKSTASLSRNIGYTVYLSNPNMNIVSYTTGI